MVPVDIITRLRSLGLELRFDHPLDSTNLHTDDGLIYSAQPGELFCFPTRTHRGYYLKESGSDLLVAQVFPTRFENYHADLLQAAVECGLSRTRHNQIYTIVLPSDLERHIDLVDCTPTKPFKSHEISAAEDTPLVILNYRIQETN